MSNFFFRQMICTKNDRRGRCVNVNIPEPFLFFRMPLNGTSTNAMLMFLLKHRWHGGVISNATLIKLHATHTVVAFISTVYARSWGLANKMGTQTHTHSVYQNEKCALSVVLHMITIVHVSYGNWIDAFLGRMALHTVNIAGWRCD